MIQELKKCCKLYYTQVATSSNNIAATFVHDFGKRIVVSWHRHTPAVLFANVHRWQAQLARLAARKAPFAQMPEAQLWFPNSYCRRLKLCWGVEPKVWCFPTMCTKEEVKIEDIQYWKILKSRVCMQTVRGYELRGHIGKMVLSISCIILLILCFGCSQHWIPGWLIDDWGIADAARSCQQQRTACAAQNARPKPRIAKNISIIRKYKNSI